jgi:hypothetical protein
VPCIIYLICRNGFVSYSLPPSTPTHYQHHSIGPLTFATATKQNIHTWTIDTATLSIQTPARPPNRPANVSSSAVTIGSHHQGLHHNPSEMSLACSALPTTTTTNMPPNLYTRTRTAGNASRPQRPGPARPVQPRDGDTRYSYASMSSRQDPQPRDPGNGRRSRGPQPRYLGGKRDPQPRDPGT